MGLGYIGLAFWFNFKPRVHLPSCGRILHKKTCCCSHRHLVSPSHHSSVNPNNTIKMFTRKPNRRKLNKKHIISTKSTEFKSPNQSHLPINFEIEISFNDLTTTTNNNLLEWLAISLKFEQALVQQKIWNKWRDDTAKLRVLVTWIQMEKDYPRVHIRTSRDEIGSEEIRDQSAVPVTAREAEWNKCFVYWKWLSINLKKENIIIIHKAACKQLAYEITKLGIVSYSNFFHFLIIWFFFILLKKIAKMLNNLLDFNPGPNLVITL